jgi:hypothetical protein
VLVEPHAMPALAQALASVALRVSIGSRRGSAPSSSGRSKAYRNVRSSAGLSGGFAGQRLEPVLSQVAGNGCQVGKPALPPFSASDGGTFGRTRCRRRNWMLR